MPESLRFNFPLKDKCFKCKGDVFAEYQETDFTRFVRNQQRVICDKASKYDGTFNIKGSIIKQGKIYFVLCPKCQKTKETN